MIKHFANLLFEINTGIKSYDNGRFLLLQGEKELKDWNVNVAKFDTFCLSSTLQKLLDTVLSVSSLGWGGSRLHTVI